MLQPRNVCELNFLYRWYGSKFLVVPSIRYTHLKNKRPLPKRLQVQAWFRPLLAFWPHSGACIFLHRLSTFVMA